MQAQPTITGTTLHLPAIRVGFFGSVPEAIIDLAPLTGQTIRVYIDHHGRYSLDQAAHHHVWPVAELTVPATKDKKGEPKDLSAMALTLYDLPEARR